MKKKILFLCAFALGALMFNGCSLFPRYTSTERLYQLQPGNSYESVVATLGCDPYNLLSKQFEGRDIYVYKYKIVERKFSPRRIDWRGIGAETRGIERYNPSWEDAFLIFKDDKLESVVTTVGLSRRGSITLIRINNTLYEVSNKRGEYTIKLSDPKPEEIIVGRGLKKRRHKR
ncbi:MAG: hypothetical protein II894_00615 [Bacteroidales bacterium]|nr:hypothetical protein [Bacteroidales bacterium]MBQ9508988.1 hypothetical protein [Bacteroidales bacterium]